MAGGGAGGEGRAEGFARGLTHEERTLLEVRDELYGGSWDDVESDLRARLANRPYIIKLSTKIEEDLERIERMRRFEGEAGVDLRQVLREIEAARGGGVS
jgi:hypothetical protein